MNLAETWRLLEEDLGIDGVSGRVQRRILPEGRRNVFLGLEMPSGNRMLILRVSADSLQGQPDPPVSRGLNVRMENRGVLGGGAELELVLTDAQHHDIFDLLVRDLVEAAEQPWDEGVGVTRLLARLSDWQHLLRRLSPSGLSAEGQRGLWGELWVLREVVTPALGLQNAVNAWRGPMGADQDFQMGAICVEVKTSAAHTLDRVPISSERQLEVPEDVILILVGLSLDARVGHGETLADMIRAIRTAAAEAGCLSHLDDRLERSGYGVEDADLHKEIGYLVRSFEPFRVGSDFPKLVSTGLPAGVSDVRYRVSLAACLPHCMSEQSLNELLRDCP